MKVKDLKAAPYNPRMIETYRLDFLEQSMKEFGDLSGIVVNVRTGNIIGGHQRVKVFDADSVIEKQKLVDDKGTVAQGYIKTPYGQWIYREVDWDEDKEKMANIAANKHSGEWNYPDLSKMLVELETKNCDMELMGYTDTELEQLFDHTMPYGASMDRSDQDDRFKDNSDKDEEIIISIICGNRDEYNKIIKFLDVSTNKQIIDARILIDALEK